MSDLLERLVELIRLERLDDNLFRGQSQVLATKRVFGGQVLGQALSAAGQTVEQRSVHSLHGYFLRAGDATAPIIYSVERMRDGGSFTARRVVATQHGRPIFEASMSFHVPESGPDHHATKPDVTSPEDLLTSQDVVREYLESGEVPEKLAARLTRPQPIEIRQVLPDHPLRPRIRVPYKQVWMRTSGTLPDDPSLHQTLLAYASDHSLLGTALRPHGLTFLDRRLQSASLDHAMWFHRPFRFDDWLLYTMDTPTASGARGFTRGHIFDREGRLVASTCQEGLTRVREASEG
ncbi:MAG: acyl-CoA thioesterase II [Ectothiorhodospiraceae bacterium]|nr:acyl-CoA thioesterase II [Ectothiorhodospiraceae bacterium]